MTPCSTTDDMRMQHQSQKSRLSTEGFVRLAQLVPAIIPVSPATIWRMVASGEFPPPVKLSKRIAAWRTTDVSQWINSRKPGESNDEK